MSNSFEFRCPEFSRSPTASPPEIFASSRDMLSIESLSENIEPKLSLLMPNDIITSITNPTITKKVYINSSYPPSCYLESPPSTNHVCTYQDFLAQEAAFSTNEYFVPVFGSRWDSSNPAPFNEWPSVGFKTYYTIPEKIFTSAIENYLARDAKSYVVSKDENTTHDILGWKFTNWQIKLKTELEIEFGITVYINKEDECYIGYDGKTVDNDYIRQMITEIHAMLVELE